MFRQWIYPVVASIIIMLSTPLGRIVVNKVYYNENLSGAYITILNGFIHSFMLIGILIFIMGLVDAVINNKTKS